jgi:GNAT superfamily N-acetyltransferase
VSAVGLSRETVLSDEADPEVVITEGVPPTPEEVASLRASVGWAPRDPEVLARAIATGRWVTARVGGRLVGMGRCISDGGLYASIWDMVVHPAYQRRGIGRRIFEALLAPCAEYELVVLVATPAGAPLYRQYGFAPETRGSTALALRPREAAAARRPSDPGH